MTEQHKVVIAAAVAAVMGENAVILRIRESQPAPATSRWTRQGRVDLQSSHDMRRRPERKL